MTAAATKLTDPQIISRLLENQPLAWQGLYDEYAPAMYGLILKLTEDNMLADQILAHAFLQLKEEAALVKIKSPLFAFLLKHSYCTAITHLKQSGIIPKTLKLQRNATSQVVCSLQLSHAI